MTKFANVVTAKMHKSMGCRAIVVCACLQLSAMHIYICIYIAGCHGFEGVILCESDARDFLMSPLERFLTS